MNMLLIDLNAFARNIGTGLESSSHGSLGRHHASVNKPLILRIFSFKLLIFLKFVLYILLLLLLCGDIESNPGPTRTLNKCRVLYHNIRGLYCNLNDLQISSQNYDIILCSETLVSNNRHVSEVLLPDFNKPTLLRRDSRPRVRGLAVYIRAGFSATVRKENVCNCHEIQLIRVCSRSNNFYIFSLYRNPDLDDSIYDCILSSI